MVNLQEAEAYCVATRTACFCRFVITNQKGCERNFDKISWVENGFRPWIWWLTLLLSELRLWWVATICKRSFGCWTIILTRCNGNILPNHGWFPTVLTTFTTAAATVSLMLLEKGVGVCTPWFFYSVALQCIVCWRLTALTAAVKSTTSTRRCAMCASEYDWKWSEHKDRVLRL